MDRPEQLLEAAARRFALYGFRRTVLDDIARDAGIAKGSIYLHAAGKEDLFIQTVLREQRLMAEAARAATEGAQDPRRAIAEIVARMLRWLDERPLMGRIMTGDQEMGLGPELARQVGESCHREHPLHDEIVRWIRLGSAQGLFRGDLLEEGPVTIVISMFHVYLYNKRQRFIELDDDLFIRELLRILFEGIQICERGQHAPQ